MWGEDSCKKLNTHFPQHRLSKCPKWQVLGSGRAQDRGDQKQNQKQVLKIWKKIREITNSHELKCLLPGTGEGWGRGCASFV